MRLLFILFLCICFSCEPVSSSKNDLPSIILIDDSDISLMVMLNTNSKGFSSNISLELKKFFRNTKIDYKNFVNIEFYKFSDLDYKKMFYNEEYERLKEERLFFIDLKKTNDDSIDIDKVYINHGNELIII